MKKLFKKNEGRNKKELNRIEINNLISIEGYKAGLNGNLYVAQVDNLVLYLGFNSKKPMQGVRTLIATAKVTENPHYGDKLIIVDRKFSKLSKKEQLSLLEYENAKNRVIDSRFKGNHGNDVSSTNKDVKAAALLSTMETHGVKPITKGLRKNEKVMHRSAKPIGKQLNKEYRKADSDSSTLKEKFENGFDKFRKNAADTVEDVAENIAPEAK